MFRSQAGGACDCGDISVMKKEGFCPRHGPEQAQKKVHAPQDLVAIAEVMMPKLILRLIQHLRDNCRPGQFEFFIIEHVKFCSHIQALYF